MLECWRVQVCSNALIENNKGHLIIGIGANKGGGVNRVS
jgi:hypothetical protein